MACAGRLVIGATHVIILSNVIFRYATFQQRERLSECVIVVYSKLRFSGISWGEKFCY